MQSDEVPIELGGHQYRLRFTLSAMVRLQKALGLSGRPNEVIAALLSSNQDMEITRAALWASCKPTNGGPTFGTPDDFGDEVPLHDYARATNSLWEAIAAQFPDVNAEAAGNDPLLLPPEQSTVEAP